MKKILFFLVLTMFLVSCGESQEDIDAAKEKMNVGQSSQEEVTQNEETPNISQSTGSMIEDQTGMIQINPLTSVQFIEINPLSDSLIGNSEIEITGKTLAQVDKIEVSFSNADSDFSDDVYTLQTFTSGDATFTYNASSGFKVLDFGKNIYVFTAYSGRETSQTQVIISVPKEEDSVVKGQETQLIGTEDNTVLVNLPTSSKYGEPIKLGEDSFTYSQIKSLEIKKEILSSVTCEGLSDYLKERLNTWYYWNTCRDIVKEKGIKFNVLRLDGDNYIYERHYIDFTNGFYGTYELETGTGVNKDTIAEKNTELKDIEFSTGEIVDDLMKDIIQQ